MTRKLPLLLSAWLLAALPVSAATYTWDGSASGLWLNVANWSSLPTAPLTDDEFVFPSAGANKTMTNDLGVGLDARRFTFSGSGYSLSGDRIDLSSSLADAPLVRATHTSGTTQLDLPFGLLEASTFSSAAGGTLALLANADISTAGNTLTLAAAGVIDVGSTISGLGQVTLSGAGTVRYDAAQTYTGGTNLNTGTLMVTSTMTSAITAAAGTTLGGTGTTAAVTTSGEISPGDGARGRLTVSGNLAFGGVAGETLTLELGANTTAGTTYDQLRCQGTVTLNSATTTLDIVQVSGFAPTVGQAFTLLDKTSAGAITGTFNGLPQGASLLLGSRRFTISYTGGTGNDITLTMVNTLPTMTSPGGTIISEDFPTSPAAFTVGDTETAAGSLTLSASSNNPALIPNANVVFGGSGANRTVSATPLPNQSGVAVITVTVSDGMDTDSADYTVTVNPLNDAPTITALADQTINEDGTTGDLAFTIGDVETPVGSLVVTTENTNPILIPSGGLVLGGSPPNLTKRATPAANLSGSATITVRVSDGVATTSESFLVTVNAVNDPPTITPISDQTINEDGSTGALPFTIGDVESGSSLTLTATSTNPALIPTGNIVFSGAGSSRFVTVTPSANASGSSTVTVRVSDGVNVTLEPLLVTVNPVNDAPTITAIADQTISEDTTTGALAFTIADVESGAAGLTLSAATSDATLVPLSNIVLSGTGGSRFVTVTPLPSLHGTATITVTASDGVLSSDEVFVVTVNSVNDVPAFVKGPDVTVPEDAGAQTLPGWATALSAGPANEAAQTLTFIVGNDNPTLFSAPPAVASNGTLAFTPAPNAFGVANVSVRIHDNGGTANGGSDTSDAQTFVITVSGINDPPSFTATNRTVLEDSGPQSLANWALPSAGPLETQTVGFTVTENSNPSLFSAPPAVAADGTLTFTSTPDANGSAVIGVRIQDDGGTANGGSDTGDIQHFTLTVTAVNDAPSFVKGTDPTVLEDAPAQTIPGWASGIGAGPADEAGQTVSFVVTQVSGSLAFLTGPAVNGSGDLSFQALGNGSATLSIVAQDTGGTANGGANTSAAQTFTIHVTPVNDPPTFAPGPSQTLAEDSGPQSINGWATAISAGPTDEASQALNFIVTNDATAMFSEQPAVSAAGALTFTPAPDAFGTATVTVRLHDDGGTADGGNDTSAPIVFTITLTDINDAPSFVAGANQTVLEDNGQPQTIGAVVTVSGWATSISPGPGEEPAAVQFEVTGNTNPALFMAGPTVTAGGTLEYRLAENANGAATISLRLKDFAGTANGGIDTSPVQTFAITVTPVNDKPGFAPALAGLSVMEDAGPQTVASWATNISAGPISAADESGQTVDFQIVNVSNPALFSVPPAISPTGTLTFMSAPEANGVSLVTVRLHDDGGSQNGGSDTGDEVVFSITVSAVNDPPSYTRGPNQTVQEDGGPRIIPNWATGVTSGDPDDDATFVLTVVSSTLSFTSGPTISPTGTLSYTTAPNDNGTATFSLVLSDGFHTTPPETLVITATPVNDQPSFAGGPSVTVNEDAGAQTIPGWATNIATGPPTASDESTQTITFHVTLNTVPSIFSVQPEISSTGNLTFTPAPNASGATTIVVNAVDDGGTSPGINTSVSHSFTITVNPVNDPPVAVPQTVQTVRNVPVPITLAATDLESNPVTLSIATPPSHGTLSNISFPSGPLGPMNLIYIPDPGFAGADTFTFRGTDADPGEPATVIVGVGVAAGVTNVTRVWDGGAGTGFWGDAANWTGDVLPQQGDSVRFPNGAAGVGATENNLPPNFVLNQVILEATQTVTGNPIAVRGVVSSGAVNWSVPLNFIENGSIRTLPSTPEGGFLTITADVSTGPFTVALDGAMNSPSSAARLNVFRRLFGSGGITSRGEVSVRNTSPLSGVITGGIVVLDGTLAVERPVGNKIVAAGPVEVKSGAILQIGSRSSTQASIDPLDTGCAPLVRDGGFILVGPAPAGTAQRFASLDLEGGDVIVDQRCTLTITDGVTATGAGVSEIGIGSPFAALVFDGPGPNHVLDVAADARLEINAHSNAFATLPVRKSGLGSLELNGRIVFPGGLRAEGGDTNFFADLNVGGFGDDASLTAITLDGGNVSGQSVSASQFARKTGPLTSGPGGGTVTPAPGFTELRTLGVAFNPATIYRTEFLDSQVTPSRHHDIMIVEGAVDLGGAQFEMIRPPGFQPPAGQSIVIIENDGTDPIVGTFAGLPEGNVTTVGNITMRISYAGGDGNDVAILFGVLPTGNTRVWDGGGSTNNWTEAANWIGDAVPQQGDSLEFPSSAARLTPFNDFPNESAFDRIRFTGSGPSFQINGNNIRLHGGVETSGQPLTIFDTDNLLLQVTCLADQDIVKSGTRRLLCTDWKTEGHTLTLTDQVSNPPALTSNPGIQISIGGTGDVVVNGTGSVMIENGSPAHSGKVGIRSGTVVVGGLQSTRTGPIEIGGFGQPARLITFGSELIRPDATTTLRDGGTWQLSVGSPVFNPVSQTIDQIILDGGSLIADTNASFIIRGSISTTASTTSSISGVIRAGEPGGGAVTMNTAAGSVLTIGGSNTSVDATNGSFFSKIGPGTLEIDAPVTVSRFDLAQGVARFHGNAGGCLIRLIGGTLGGNGHVGDVTDISGGNVSPGTAGAPGILTSGNLVWTPSTVLNMRIQGNTPGIGHDQVAANGTVDLGGALLAATIAEGFTPSGGQSIILISNDGTDAVTGTFAGLAEGSRISISGRNFVITYSGGDGNDVALTAESPPAAPVLSVTSLIPPGANGENSDATFTGSVTGATPGSTARLEASSDLQTWVPLATRTVDPSGGALFGNVPDTGTGANPAAHPLRFYRVAIEAPQPP